MMHLDYRDGRPVYIQIMNGLRRQITAGVLQPGENLPSVRELAVQQAINPNTIQFLKVSVKIAYCILG